MKRVDRFFIHKNIIAIVDSHERFILIGQAGINENKCLSCYSTICTGGRRIHKMMNNCRLRIGNLIMTEALYWRNLSNISLYTKSYLSNMKEIE